MYTLFFSLTLIDSLEGEMMDEGWGVREGGIRLSFLKNTIAHFWSEKK
jgi:hypothetical protein